MGCHKWETYGCHQQPDWDEVIEALQAPRKRRRARLTRLQLWKEYRDEALAQGGSAYSYSRFCARLKARLKDSGNAGPAQMRFDYAPGLYGLSDFSGKVLAVRTGRGEKDVEIFVAVLAHSRLIYSAISPNSSPSRGRPSIAPSSGAGSLSVRAGPLTERTPERILKGRWRFWTLALLWLPAGVAAQAFVRFGAEPGPVGDPGIAIASLFMMPASLVPVAACGLPLALGCRRLRRLGYRRGAWVAGVVLGALTTAASVLAGLLGPIAIALFAVVLSGPVWAAWFWLRRRR